MKFRPWKLRQRKPRPLRKVALLPTLITLGNAVCGMLAIMSCIKAQYANAALYIFVGMFFDALDGKVARATGTASKFGAQLDSLCDVLTFGIVPPILVWSLCKGDLLILPERMMTVACVFYCLAAVIRLARFNIETTTDLNSHMEFHGLPSPAAAGVVASTVTLWHYGQEWAGPLVMALPPTIFLIGVLMISRVRYPHVLNKLFSGFSPFVQLVEIVVAAVLVVALKQYALYVLFVGYAVAGPVGWVANRLTRKSAAPQPDDAAGETPKQPEQEEEPLF